MGSKMSPTPYSPTPYSCLVSRVSLLSHSSTLVSRVSHSPTFPRSHAPTPTLPVIGMQGSALQQLHGILNRDFLGCQAIKHDSTILLVFLW